MPRRRTGHAREIRGKWYAQVTIVKGERPSFELSTCHDEAAANERAALLAGLAGKLVAAGHADLARRLLPTAASAEGRALLDVQTFVERVVAGQSVPKAPAADLM